MKNFIVTIFIAFLLSLILHYLFFIGFDKTLKNSKLQFSTTNKITDTKKYGFTNVKFVKIKEIKPAPKNPKQLKEKVKTTKKVIKKITKPKKTPVSKQKIETIQLPKNTQQLDLKQFFTIQKKEIEEQKSIKEEEIAAEIQKVQQLDEITQSYIKLYGEQYFAFSPTQKQYIKNNISIIGRITQKYLRYPNISARTRQSGINIVEFILMPNGDIKDLKLIDSSQYTALDQNSVNTIRIAYKDYPKPSEPTKIRIYVNYILN